MLQEYNKIQSIYKRSVYDPGSPRGSHGGLIIGDYSEEEFGNVKLWHVEEKVDGTNMRILFEKDKDGEVSFAGRSNNAQVPPDLLKYLGSVFTTENLSKAFPDENVRRVILFGEGYGGKIQAGSKYRKEVGFILFDVFVGSWVLRRQDVAEIALSLGVPMCPEIGIMSEEEIVKYVKSKPNSLCSEQEQTMEGVICRSHPLMLFRNGKPMMWKLKCKDFDGRV